MAKITKNDIMHLASLSKVSLDENEVHNLQKDLEAILGYIEQLADLDTTNAQPTYQVGALENVWREDNLEERLVSTEALLSLAPSLQQNQIKIPKVI